MLETVFVYNFEWTSHVTIDYSLLKSPSHQHITALLNAEGWFLRLYNHTNSRLRCSFQLHVQQIYWKITSLSNDHHKNVSKDKAVKLKRANKIVIARHMPNEATLWPEA